MVLSGLRLCGFEFVQRENARAIDAPGREVSVLRVRAGDYVDGASEEAHGAVSPRGGGVMPGLEKHSIWDFVAGHSG